MGQVKNVTLIIVVTAIMAFGLLGITMAVDLLPIPAMHAASVAKVDYYLSLKSGFSN